MTSLKMKFKEYVTAATDLLGITNTETLREFLVKVKKVKLYG